MKKIPPDLVDAIFSEDIAETILSIGKKYGLLIDKVGELGSATNHVILGALHPKDFIPTLEQVLGVDRETAKKIAQEVNTEIFAKIRESLRKVHNIEESGIRNQESGALDQKPAIPPPESPVKKIPFSDLKPTPPTTPIPTRPAAPVIPASPVISAMPIAPKPPVPQAAPPTPNPQPPMIRPFRGGGIKVEVKKEAAAPVGGTPADLEKEVAGILKTVQPAKPKEEPKKLWPLAAGIGLIEERPKTEVGPEEKSKPAVEVKIKTIEEEEGPPKTSPFAAKLQDGIFKQAPTEERKIIEPAPPPPKISYGPADPYRELPDEKERGGLPRKG